LFVPDSLQLGKTTLRPSERNAFISDELERLIARAKAGDGPKLDRYKNERAVLERLIPIQTDGFRGVTLTAIMGKMIRADINTSTEFYAIQPRGLFEGAIKPVLKRNRIPTGASAPLNVAKNVQVLDEKWAEGREPEDAALAAVDYIRRINRHWSDEAMRDDLIMMFVQRLVAYATEVASNDVELAPIEGAVPIELAKRLATFALAYPEGGSMPQFIAGALLVASRSTDSEYVALAGSDASVFGTNSTSNKPADLWEILPDGTFGNLYEVTCKPVDVDRLDAAVDSFGKLGLPTTPITFVCRVPGDCAGLGLVDGVVIHRGAPFQFIDFSGFVEAIFILLTPQKRMVVFERIAGFVADPSRGLKTKRAWAKAFGSNP
jgi:hypothetical protein